MPDVSLASSVQSLVIGFGVGKDGAELDVVVDLPVATEVLVRDREHVWLLAAVLRHIGEIVVMMFL